MRYLICIWYICFIILPGSCFAFSDAYGKKIYDPGKLKPTDSRLKVKTGDVVPDFTLTAVSGKKISLKQFRGKKNVLISFIPAAWTPVCSDQWPGYNIAKPFFDNLPTLYAWTSEMGNLWFDVLSDFWPHGRVADLFGVLRTDGTAERALFLIDRQGTIRFIKVSDINVRPDLGEIVRAMEQIEQNR